MAFVFSWWYIVAFVAFVGAVACLVAFICMNKKDEQIIKDFIDENSK